MLRVAGPLIVDAENGPEPARRQCCRGIPSADIALVDHLHAGRYVLEMVTLLENAHHNIDADPRLQYLKVGRRGEDIPSANTTMHPWTIVVGNNFDLVGQSDAAFDAAAAKQMLRKFDVVQTEERLTFQRDMYKC